MKQKHLSPLFLAFLFSHLCHAGEEEMKNMIDYIQYKRTESETPPNHIKSPQEMIAIFEIHYAEILPQIHKIAKTERQLRYLLSIIFCTQGEKYVQILDLWASLYPPSPMYGYMAEEIINNESAKLAFLDVNDRNKHVRSFCNQLLKKLPKDSPLIPKIKDILSGKAREGQIGALFGIGFVPEILDSSLWADEFKQWGPPYDVQVAQIKEFKQQMDSFLSLLEGEINPSTFNQATVTIKKLNILLKKLMLFKRLENTQEWLKLVRLYKEAWDKFIMTSFSESEREKRFEQIDKLEAYCKSHKKEAAEFHSIVEEFEQLIDTSCELLEGVLILQGEEQKKQKAEKEPHSPSSNSH